MPEPSGRPEPAATTALSPTAFASAVSAITSAFGDPTRRDIYLFAREHERGVTAAEVAVRFDLHPNVARHHLDKLAGGGHLEVATDRVPGSRAGRPSKRYCARPAGELAALNAPVRHDELLATLLGRALALVPRAEAEAMAEDVGVQYGQAMAAAVGGHTDTRSFRSALHAVADALTAHGFAAHAEKKGSELRIVSEHCPFGETAVEHPVICAVDRGMVKGMLAGLYGDTQPATEESLPMGSAVCVTAFDH